MAMHCKKCGGIIPDIVSHGEDRTDCKNHYKPEMNLFPRGGERWD